MEQVNNPLDSSKIYQKIVFISKQLGHSNMKTTASYLENFEERQINKWQSKVTDFEI